MKSSSLMLILVLVAGLPAGLHAQSFQANPDFRGHLIGESVADFLRIEPEAQQETNVCRQRTERRRCLELIAAVDRGQRTEVSTTSGGNYVLDAGQLVKLTVLVADTFDSAADSVSKQFNAVPRNRPSRTSAPELRGRTCFTFGILRTFTRPSTRTTIPCSRITAHC